MLWRFGVSFVEQLHARRIHRRRAKHSTHPTDLRLTHAGTEDESEVRAAELKTRKLRCQRSLREHSSEDRIAWAGQCHDATADLLWRPLDMVLLMPLYSVSRSVGSVLVVDRRLLEQKVSGVADRDTEVRTVVDCGPAA